MLPGWGAFGHGADGLRTAGLASRRFEEEYHCYSVAFADKAHVEKGDKILLPPSAFDTLSRLHIDYPMLFQLSAVDPTTNVTTTTHCGVLEFTAEEGCVYIPFWMMQNLLLSEEGALIKVKNVSLPKCTFVKLQPQSVDFLEISNPRAVLEHALRNFSCVTVGDVIQIPYNSKNYHFEIKQVEPERAACIIETDCNVDFDAPVGYQEPTTASTSATPSRTSTPNTSMHGISPSMSVPQGTWVGAAPVDATTAEDSSAAASTRIVHGQIVRPEASPSHVAHNVSNLLASRTGASGLQPNSAIPQVAPTVDYWALAAGDGARLDGKAATPLKTSSGHEINIRQLREAAAAERMKKQQQEQAEKDALLSMPGHTLSGKTIVPVTAPKPAVAAPPMPTTVPISKRKKLGTKFSKLKPQSAAFQGSANNL